MSGALNNIRAKLKRRVSHKDPNIKDTDFDDDENEWDEDTHSYVTKEVDDAEKDGEKYPMGRPNSFLNRMISHGNKKTEDDLAREAAEHQAREKLQRDAISSGQAAGAAQGSSRTS